ncbi:uncharacterized protein TNCV_1418061 [Trichonephila clavipes]|nr:uncharacterized protein TNCV_1418061 [Trichonephila clavipes]
MPSPVQSNCDAHNTIGNGQCGAVWSMGHTQQVCVRIVFLPSNVGQQFFGRSAFMRQQETDLPPAFLFADRTIYLSSAGVVLLTRPPPCRLLHIPVVLNDFHSRETTLRSCRCSGVKGSARKGRLDLRFASARCLEIVCGTIATPTSARIVEQVTVGSTSACRMILQFSPLVVFLVAPDTVFRAWVPSRVHCFQQFLTAHSERSTWPATRRVDQPAVFIPMFRLLSNSFNCEKCLLARLPGMFHLPKSSYNRRVIVTFMNLRICTGLYSTLFLIVAPPRGV